MKYVKLRHKILFPLIKFAGIVFTKFKFNFKTKNKFKIGKDESIVVLSNHQTDCDPICLSLSFNKPIYFVATDSLFVKSFSSWILNFLFAPIPKKKGALDIASISKIFRTINEGGSVGLFVEGNRSYAEFQYYIGVETIKLLKQLKKKIVIYNIHGGFGVSPRFSNKKRKGNMYGEIKRVLPYEEYKDIDNEKLLDLIKNDLKVFDSESNEKFISNKRAEYLERMLFVCPKCGKIETLESNGNFIECKNCGLKVEYTEDLKLISNDKDFKFNILNDWYQFQKNFVKKYKITNNVQILNDIDVKIYTANAHEKRLLIDEGEMDLSDKYLSINKTQIPLSEINSASPVSGIKLSFSTEKNNYLIIGNKKFNALKYVLFFNKLDTYMKEHKIDNYYNLE